MGTGIASPQARLLTLTSRMHDLELQCMRYSNEEIMNAMKSSNIAIRYNQALEAANNITVGLSPSSIREYSKSYQSLKYGGSTINYNMLKQMGYDIQPTGVSGAQGGSGSGWTMPTNINEFLQLMQERGIATKPYSGPVWTMSQYMDNDGNIINESKSTHAAYLACPFLTNPGNPSEWSTIAFDATLEFDQAKLEQLLGPMDGGVEYTDDQNELLKQAMEDSSFLIEAILQGLIDIVDEDGAIVTLNDIGIEEVTETRTEQETIMTLDTKKRDDARQAAQSEYDAAMAQMQREEKVLQMKSKNAQTQYQACCTEYDSVKQLVGENADTGFNIFG
ncbi:hypothetical protein IJ818_01765 [bacterium]|nr:hypothetical protein [bacterium]